MLQILQHKI